MHAKIAQNWQIALFNYFCLSELFATLYISIASCKTIKLTKLMKKSNCNTLKDICMHFCCSDNLETQFLAEKLRLACKHFKN